MKDENKFEHITAWRRMCGRPQTVYNAENEHHVKVLLETNQHIKLKDSAYTINVTNISVYWIVHDVLGHWKVSASAQRTD